MKKTTALTLVAMLGAASSAQAQVSTFSYVGEVTESQDGLNIFGASLEGSQATGGFTLDLDADIIQNPQGGDFLSFFEALGLNVAIDTFGVGGNSVDDDLVAFAHNNLETGLLDSGEEGPVVDTLEISLSFPTTAEYDFGSVNVLLVGTEDWFDRVDSLPDPLSMGFENLLRAEVVIEFFRLPVGGGDARRSASGLASSRAVIDISSLSNAEGTVATIGCRSFQFAPPVAQFDFFDVSAFISEFSAQSPAADMNLDGVINFFDVSAFVTQIQTTCSN